jgi:hypothetical protein
MDGYGTFTSFPVYYMLVWIMGPYLAHDGLSEKKHRRTSYVPLDETFVPEQQINRHYDMMYVPANIINLLAASCKCRVEAIS